MKFVCLFVCFMKNDYDDDYYNKKCVSYYYTETAKKKKMFSIYFTLYGYINTHAHTSEPKNYYQKKKLSQFLYQTPFFASLSNQQPTTDNNRQPTTIH